MARKTPAPKVERFDIDGIPFELRPTTDPSGRDTFCMMPDCGKAFYASKNTEAGAIFHARHGHGSRQRQQRVTAADIVAAANATASNASRRAAVLSK